jgi:acylaminoacyl-peptidase
MHFSRRVALSFAILALGTSAAARPFTARDLASLDRVSSPSVSPDGRYVAYALRSTDWDANKGVNALHVIDLKGDPAKPLVLLSGEKGGASPAWSDDGRWLYFISGKSGSAQVWRANADGSVRQQLTSFPVDVAGFKLAPDLHTLIVVAGVYPDCATLACTKARTDAKAKEKGSAIEIKGGEARWWDSYIDETRLALFRVDLAQPGAPSDAAPIVRNFDGDLPPDGDTDAMAVSPDGRTLYFASNEPGADRGGQSFSRIYAVPADGSAAPRVVVASPGTAAGSPALSPDGARLAYLTVTAPAFTPGRTQLMLMDLTSGRSRATILGPGPGLA